MNGKFSWKSLIYIFVYLELVSYSFLYRKTLYQTGWQQHCFKYFEKVFIKYLKPIQQKKRIFDNKLWAQLYNVARNTLFCTMFLSVLKKPSHTICYNNAREQGWQLGKSLNVGFEKFLYKYFNIFYAIYTK